MKKLISVILALCFILPGIFPLAIQAGAAEAASAQAAGDDNPIESIEVEPLTLIEHSNGYFVEYIDESTGEKKDYFYYGFLLPKLTVNLKNGESVVYENSFEYNGTEYYANYTSTQGYKNQWGLGVHTITVSLMGVSTECNVEIVESPIERIEVPEITLIEEYDTVPAYDRNDPDGVLREYRQYNMPHGNFTVYLKSGEVLDCNRSFEYCGRSYPIRFSSDQSYDNQWGVGHHTAVATLADVETEVSVNIIENPIERLEVSDVKIIEGSSGYITSGYLPDGSYAEWRQYYYDVNATVYLKDGTVLENVKEYRGEYIYSEDDQSYENQWGVGKHTASGFLLGIESQFTVEIIEAPIERIVAQGTQKIYEGTNLTTVTEMDGSQYNKYMFSLPTFTVYFKDGTSQSINNCLNYEGTEYPVYFADDQSADNVWGVGEHTVHVEIMGFKSEFKVVILESIVEKIEIDDISVVEGTHVNQAYDFDENGNRIPWIRYNTNDYGATVYFKDGSTATVWGSYLLPDGTWCELYTYSDQSSKNPWGPGKHKVKASFMGAETEFTLTITESPIERLEVNENVTLIEGINCSDYTWFDNETGEAIASGKRYFGLNPNEFTVYLKDGNSIVCDGAFQYKGVTYWPDVSDDQDEGPWDLGKHTVTLSLMGAVTEYTVELIETPVERIEIEDMSVMENLDGYLYEPVDYEGNLLPKYFCYNQMPQKATVYFKDGSSAVITDGEFSYKGKYYYLELLADVEQYIIPWKKGETHCINASVLGVETSYNITVVENPYVSLSANGGNDFTLTFTRGDGKKDVFKITSVILNGPVEDTVYCDMITDSGKVFEFVKLVKSGSDFSEKFTLTVGTMTCTVENGNNWVNADILSNTDGYTVRNVCQIISDCLGVDFTGFDGKVTAENLDSLIILASYLYLPVFDNPDTVFENGKEYALFTADDIASALSNVFGITDADLTKSSLYSAGKIKMPRVSYGGDGRCNSSLVYENGLFLRTYTEEGFGKVIIAMDENAKIKSISVEKITPPEPPANKRGDINGDGKVTAIDSYLIKRIIVGTYIPGIAQRKAADVNGDGKITSIDSYLIKRLIVGTANF